MFQFKLYVPSPLSKSIGAAADRKVRDWKCHLTAVILYDNFSQENNKGNLFCWNRLLASAIHAQAMQLVW